MKRDKTIDIIRVFGLIWVMLIHSIFWINFGFFAPFWQVFDSFLLFEMPIMFFVSGASNAKTSAKTPREFYKKRFLQILVPYLAYLAFVVVFTIVINYFRGISLLSFIRPRNWYNFFVHNISIPGTSHLMGALWFVPIYLAVILIFPWLKQFYDHYQDGSKKFLPLVGLTALFIGANLVSFRACSFVRMILFYSIWMYTGLFYERLNFKNSQGKLKYLVLGVVLLPVIYLISRKGHFSLIMQHNKFPPNILFLIYSISAMAILYALSSWIVAWFQKQIKQSPRFKRIFDAHNHRGYTIYLYHPLSVIGASLIFAIIDPRYSTSSHAWFRTLCFFVIIVCLNTVLAKIFGWIEDIDYQAKLSQISWRKIPDHFRTIFLRTYHYIVIAVFGLASLMMIEREASNWRRFLIYAVSFSGVLMAIRWLGGRNFQPKHEKIIIASIAFLAFGLRISYVMWLQASQFSDYKVFLDTGVMISSGDFSNIVLVKYVSLFKHILGYASVVGLVFAVFGQKIMAVWVMNCLLASVSVVLLYVIASKLFSKKTAIIASSALAVFPSYIASAPLLFQGHMTIPLFLLALYFYLCSESSRKFLYLGLTLAVLEVMRPVAIILAVAIVLNELIIRRPRLKNISYKLAMLLIPFVIIPSAYYKTMSHVMKSDLAGLSWFTIFVGMSDRGCWTLEDAEILGKYVYINDDPKRPTGGGMNNRRLTEELISRDGAKKVQARMRDETIARMRANRRNISWLQQKIFHMWAGDVWSVHVLQQKNFGAQRLEKLARIVNLFYVICLACLTWTAIIQLTQRNLEISFLLLFLAGFIALHIITEVASRYHFMITPLLALALALVLTEDCRKTKSDESLGRL